MGFNDPVYCERKAMEYIAEAQFLIEGEVKGPWDHTKPDEVAKIWQKNDKLRSDYTDKMKMAVFLLTISRFQRNESLQAETN